MRLPACFAWLALALPGLAQFPGLTLPPSGGNQRSSVTQYIGPVQVTIDYSSPRVTLNGQDRRGKIWGQLVPYGLTDPGFGNGKPAPWRAGANENTVFTVSHAVTIEGKPLAAGRYGLHMIPGKDEWTLIFSRNSTSWGSFTYEESEDALRVAVKPRPSAYREWLTYEFPERGETHATVELQWEELAVPWKIQVPNLREIYLSRLREDLRTQPGFHWQGYVTAAQYTVQSGNGLEQGLEWAEAAISKPFIGQENFLTLQTKAQVLDKMNRKDEAARVMAKAVRHPGALPAQIHQYGRALLSAGRKDEAMEVFELNVQRFGDRWPTHVGMARGYAAKGDAQKALDHAKKALAQAPDELNRKSLQAMIQALSEGKPVL